MAASHHRQQSSMRAVPWGSWREWDCVRAALYSSSISRIKSAIDRVAAWRSKGGVPIAVEITAELFSIHHRDPKIMPDIATQFILSEEMLRMMYAMAIMRLVNGVVDQSKGSTMSVAYQAEIACLPRILVDIRHESAHNELPGISLLRVASKQALHWLEHKYWQQQREALKNVEVQLKLKLLEYLSLLKRFNLFKRIDSKKRLKGDKDQKMENARKAAKQLFDELLELSSSGVSDVVSILLDKGLLEQSVSLKRRKCYVDLINDVEQDSLQEPSEMEDEIELEASLQEPSEMENEIGLTSMTDMALKDTLCRLSIFMPQLLSRLLMGIVCRLLGRGGAVSDSGYCLHLERELHPVFVPNDQKSYGTMPSTISLLQSEEFNRLILWLSWLLDNHHKKMSEKQKLSRERLSYTEELQRYEIKGDNCILGELPNELLQEVLSLSLKSSLDRDQIVELVSIISAHVGPTFRGEKLSRLAKLSKPFGNMVQGDGQDFWQGREKTNLKKDSNKTKVDDNSFNGNALIQGARAADIDELKTDELDVDFFAFKEQQQQLLRFSAHSSRPQKLTADFSFPGQASGKDQLISKKRWRLADPWFPCAIGLLPSQLCASGVRPPWLQSCTESLCVGNNEVACPQSDTLLDGTLSQVDMAHCCSLVNDSGQDKVVIIDVTETSELNDLQPPHKKEKVVLETFGGSGVGSIYDRDKNKASRLVSVHGDEEDFGDNDCLEELPSSIQGCVLQNGIFKTLSVEQILALQKEIHVW